MVATDPAKFVEIIDKTDEDKNEKQIQNERLLDNDLWVNAKIDYLMKLDESNNFQN